MTLTKVCSLCGQRRYRREFSQHPKTADGLDPRCKRCVRAYQESMNKPYLCAFCQEECLPQRRFCSEDCRRKHKVSHTSNAPARDRHEYGLGPKAFPGLNSALCCGEALAFGTDRLGRTVETCRVCGERPVRARGARKYDQGKLHADETQALVESAQSPAKPRKQMRRGQKQIVVIGRALADRIHAA